MPNTGRAIGSVDASDAAIMACAHAHGYVVITRDLDFSAMLGARGAGHPSVVQIRADAANPDVIGDVVVGALPKTADALDAGALVSIDPVRARVRLLPLP